MERFVSTTATLDIVPRPGLTVVPYDQGGYQRVALKFTGTLGVRELNRLIEEATALRDELSAAIG